MWRFDKDRELWRTNGILDSTNRWNKKMSEDHIRPSDLLKPSSCSVFNITPIQKRTLQFIHCCCCKETAEGGEQLVQRASNLRKKRLLSPRKNKKRTLLPTELKGKLIWQKGRGQGWKGQEKEGLGGRWLRWRGWEREGKWRWE